MVSRLSTPFHGLQTRLSLLLFFILTLYIAPSNQVTRQYWPKFWECDDTKGNFTLNSTYSLNLATAFSNLTSFSSSHHFSNVSVGSDDDIENKVYALYDCRNDLSVGKCHGCVEDATKNALDLCYRQPKEGIVIYEECMLRYANRMIFSTMELSPNYTNCAGVKLLLDRGQIEAGVRRNLESLIDEATLENSSSSRYYAVENERYKAQREFYFLVQCTPDLSRAQCKECLTDALNFTIESCASDSRLWGQIKGPSCQMRYDVAPFFNVSSSNIVPPTPSPQDFSGQHAISFGRLTFFTLVFFFALL